MEIPLFPLPNLVLFPRVAVPLHIFEDRYKLMINRCIDQADVFGLVLLQEGAEEENEETISRVGVTARVVQVERFDDGRMNVLCAGESRFSIRTFTGKEPYWTGIVEFFEDDPQDDERLNQARDTVGGLYRKAMELMSQLKDAEAPEVELPDSAVNLSYMVSYVLDLPAPRKQELLELSSTEARLDALATDLQEILQQLKAQINRKHFARKASLNGDLGKPH
jgi:Lon protease-like protein